MGASIILVGNLGRSIVLAPDAVSQHSAFADGILPYTPGSPSQGTILNVNVVDADAGRNGPEVSAVVTATLYNPPLILESSSAQANMQRFIKPGAAPNARALSRPYARVQWGAGGGVAEAFLDYENGFSFSIPASWLRIDAINEYIPPDSARSGAGTQYGRAVQVGAFAGIGNVGKSGTLTAKRTIYVDKYIYGTGANSIFTIPPFATNFLIYAGNLDAAIIGIEYISAFVLDEAGNASMIVQFPLASNQDVPTELPGDARYIMIGGNATYDNATLRIIFGLAI